MTTTTLKPQEIKVVNRARQDLGDIRPLAASMADVGLLHRPVVNSAYEVIAGARRLAAAVSLNWTHIPVTVADDLNDVHAAARAERDENICRLDFAPSEAVAMTRRLELLERAKAAVVPVVYFMRGRHGGPIRIGLSRSPVKRLRVLRPGNPDRLQILGTISGGPAVEKAVHTRFVASRLSGKWFYASDELLAFITVDAQPFTPEVSRGH